MSSASIMSASVPASMFRRAPCRITPNRCISSRRSSAGASPQRKPERSLAVFICASSAPPSAETPTHGPRGNVPRREKDDLYRPNPSSA